MADCRIGPAWQRHIAALPGALIYDGKTLSVDEIDEVRVAALGKAADALMEQAERALEVCLPGCPRRSLAIAHTVDPLATHHARRIVGGHPLPDAASFEAGRALVELFTGCTRRTLALFLVSGGGSALAELPLDPELDVARLATLTERMLRSSLSIRQINAMRKHISLIKGGRLAALAEPAVQLTIVVSDVMPGDPASVASGPSLQNDTTVAEAAGVVSRLGLDFPIRLTAAPRLAAGAPAPVCTILDWADAAGALADQARRAGFLTFQLSDAMQGPLELVLARHLDEVRQRRSNGGPIAVVSAGEVALEVRGGGRGGRNQQMVLEALLAAQEELPEVVVLCAGSDGRDGPSDAAGARGCSSMLARGQALGLDAARMARDNDAYTFFERTGGLVVCGPTGTNVGDLRIFLHP